MSKEKKDIVYKNVWDYLEQQGLLTEESTEAQIEAGKKAYWKWYRNKHKQNQRKSQPEITVSFSSKSEYVEFKQLADVNARPLSVFLKEAALAYSKQDYLEINSEHWKKIDQVLSMFQMKMFQLEEEDDEGMYYHRNYQLLMSEIYELKTKLDEILNHPPLLENSLRATLIKAPWKKSDLQKIINQY